MLLESLFETVAKFMLLWTAFFSPNLLQHARHLKPCTSACAANTLSSDSCVTVTKCRSLAQERQKLLAFVVVGGGPTGVEVAAELYDLVRDDLRRFYPEIYKDARVCLVELQDHVLSTYDRKISEYTSQVFSRRGSTSCGLKLACDTSSGQLLTATSSCNHGC